MPADETKAALAGNRILSWRRARLAWIAAGAAFVGVAGGLLAFGPVVRAAATAEAARRGVNLDVGGVRPGWMSIHLTDTRVTLHDAPDIAVQLERVVVRLNPWLSLRGISAEGGEVALKGSADSIVKQLKAWRAARGQGGSSSASERSGGLNLAGHDLKVSWTAFDEVGAQRQITGLHFERNADGARFGFKAAELALPYGSWAAGALEATLGITDAGLALEHLTAGQVVVRIALPLPTPASPSAGDALEPQGARPPPLANRQAKLDNQARLDKGKKGLIKPNHRSKKPGAGQGGQRLQELLSRNAGQAWADQQATLSSLRRLLARAIADGGRVELPAVRLELSRGTSSLNVGPAPLRVERKGDVLEAAFTPPADASGKSLAVTGKLPLSNQGVEINFEGGPISLATLGVREGDFGLLGVSQTALTLATQASLDPVGTVKVSASGELRGLALQHPSLAPEPLRDMDFSWGGEITVDLKGRRLEISGGALSLEKARVELDASVQAGGDDLKVNLNLRVPSTPCQDLFQAAPASLLPMLSTLELGGLFQLSSNVSFDTADPASTRVDWELGNECKVVKTPEEVDPARFSEPFQYFVLDADGRAMELTTGPTTDRWVPLSDISPNLETALVVCEDSRFFRHRGFDNEAIRDSISDNLKAGHFVRGGSTLTMQLAKNLYLSRDKTLSRKLQEAVLTLLLEERLSKQDILELYLNVVEFGPGIYGIRQGAQHYFNSHPGELSLGQALFFGSILPRPKANHFSDTGALNAGWAQHLQYLMKIARKIKRIGDDELEAGLGEQLQFGKPHPDSESDFLFGAPLFEMSDG